MNQSTLSHLPKSWEDLSAHVKKIIDTKRVQHEKLIALTIEHTLLFLSSALKTLKEHPEQKALMVTDSVSDAITLRYLIEAMMPSLEIDYLLPHQEIKIKKSTQLLLYPAINAQLTTHESFDLSAFNCLFFNTFPRLSLSTSKLLSDLHEEKRLGDFCLVPLNYHTLTETEEVPVPAKKISLKRKEPSDTAEPAKKEVTDEPASEKAKISIKSKAKKALATDVVDHDAADNDVVESKEKAEALNASPKAPLSEQTEGKKSAPKELPADDSHEVAFVKKNFERQYIRDLIRSESLTRVVVISHSRQHSKQLGNYLYRARIQSRILHERLKEDARENFIERFNHGNIAVLILNQRDINLIEGKVEGVNKVIFYQLPVAYVEFTDRLSDAMDRLAPKTTLSLASENEEVWVTSLKEECPDLKLAITPLSARKEREPRENRDRRERPEQNRSQQRRQSADTQAQTDAAANAPGADTPTHTGEREQRDNRRRPQQNRGRRQDRNDRNDRNERNDRNDHQQDRRDSRDNRDRDTKRTSRNQTRRPRREQHDYQDEPNFNRIDEGNEQLNIVNKNRLPFESGSFEANIAKVNKNRMRQVFSNQQRNIQNHGNLFTQESSPNHNPNSHHNSNSNNQRRRNQRNTRRNNNPNNNKGNH